MGNWLNILKAILFGIVEGITEWLPISSTGHMILLNEFVTLDVSPEFWNMFLVVIQLGAILAVVVLYWKKLFPFNFSGGPFIKKHTFLMWFKIIVACIPAAIVGILFDEKLEELFYNYWVVSIALIVFGILFIVVENVNRGKKARIRKLSQITYPVSIFIGLFQLIAAIFPGTSRSGATIVGGLIAGVSRSVSAEFTFFMAVPVMLGASLLKVIQYGLSFTVMELVVLLAGMLTAFIVSIMIITFLMGYIKRHDFKVFGWYRIVLGVLVLVYFLIVG